MDISGLRSLLSRDLTDTIIRIGLVALLLVACVQIVLPFAGLLIWALILAIALFPLHRALAARLGGRQGLAATCIVLLGLLIIGTPTVMLGGSFAVHLQDAHQQFESGSFKIPPPYPGIAAWPLIGPRLFEAWNAAAENLPAVLSENRAQLRELAIATLTAAASTAGSIAMFFGSLVIAGIMMAWGETGSEALQRIFCRLTDSQRGPRLQRLATATVRSVASGVIGVAFIQSLLLGIGFLMAGIPAAGVLAFLTLLIGILQLPALLISIPAMIFLWGFGDGSTAANMFWTVYLLIAGMTDNVLKPLLLGRGVDAPMPVILIGALGGMVWSGFIGLFAGAVLLAVGYQVLMEWVDNPTGAATPQAPTA